MKKLIKTLWIFTTIAICASNTKAMDFMSPLMGMPPKQKPQTVQGFLPSDFLKKLNIPDAERKMLGTSFNQAEVEVIKNILNDNLISDINAIIIECQNPKEKTSQITSSEKMMGLIYNRIVQEAIAFQRASERKTKIIRWTTVIISTSVIVAVICGFAKWYSSRYNQKEIDQKKAMGVLTDEQNLVRLVKNLGPLLPKRLLA